MEIHKFDTTVVQESFMDQHAQKFYRQASDDFPEGHFYKVIALHDKHSHDWQSLHQLVPSLPKGWFELSSLVVSDRIEFLRDFWISKMPYHPKLQDFLVQFFHSIDDISIFNYNIQHMLLYKGRLLYIILIDTILLMRCNLYSIRTNPYLF